MIGLMALVQKIVWPLTTLLEPASDFCYADQLTSDQLMQALGEPLRFAFEK